MTDESSIRELQQAWFRATMDGDVSSIRELMSDDVVFLTVGRPPFGRDEFIDSFTHMSAHVSMQCSGELDEVVVSGDVAFARAHLNVIATPNDGGPAKHLSGNTLSVFRRSAEGKWRLCRDANLLTPTPD